MEVREFPTKTDRILTVIAYVGLFFLLVVPWLLGMTAILGKI